MDNLFIKNVNLCCINRNQFSKIKTFFDASCYYITTHQGEEKHYNSILNSVGLKPKKVYALEPTKTSKTTSLQECSYLETWKSILKEEKNSYVLMLDDDVRFSYNFSTHLRAFLASVPEDWDILYLGASQHRWQDIHKQNNYYKAHNTKGSFAVFMSPSGVQKVNKILQETDYSKPLDELLHLMCANKYVAYPNVVISDVAQSTMRKPRNVQTHAERMQWNLNNYDYFKYLRIKVLFVVNTKLSKQSYKNITYFYINNEENLKNNENYEEKRKKHEITIIYNQPKLPSQFYVENKIKFILKTEQ